MLKTGKSKKSSQGRSTSKPITRSDIEEKLREIQAGLDLGNDSGKTPGLAVGIGVVLVVVLVAYLFGRRSAKNRRSFIEIRRR